MAHIDQELDRITLFGGLLDQLAAIHRYYQEHSERVIGVTASCQVGELFEAGVMREHKLYYVKLRVLEGGIIEYGREEDMGAH